MDFNSVITFVACIIFILIFGKIFIWPLKNIVRLIFNSVLGGILISIINIIGSSFNFHIGLNMITSILVGLLGVPGAILLIILKIILRLILFIIYLTNRININLCTKNCRIL